MTDNPLYNLNIDQYRTMLENGTGKLIFGKDWPSNEAVFKSNQTRHFALRTFAQVTEEFVNQTGASAQDVVALIEQYGELVFDIHKDIQNGVISEQDKVELVEWLDGGDD